MKECVYCKNKNPLTARFCSHCGSPLTANSMLLPGTVLQNRYKILSILGQGGMGAVYLAEDQQTAGTRWAIKELQSGILPPADRQQAIQQFEQEARLLSHLHHANLPRIETFFVQGTQHYLVMEYIEGQTLETLMQRTPGFLAEVYVLNWALQICDVLDYLHSHTPPIIFRDLKPANIMLTYDGVAKLIDFGIARLFNPAKGKDTVFMGTPGYAPPEQYGQGQTDARTDIYALGATMHHLLTRHDPANNLQPFAFPYCETLSSAISPKVAAVIQNALEAQPAKRHRSATEMKQSLLSTTPATAATSATADITAVDIAYEHDGFIMYKAVCVNEARETVWACKTKFFNYSPGISCSCTECDRTIVSTTIDIASLKQAKLLLSFCHKCKEKTHWLVSKGDRICHGCGAQR